MDKCKHFIIPYTKQIVKLVRQLLPRPLTRGCFNEFKGGRTLAAALSEPR
jgi:hypothetical protein